MAIAAGAQEGGDVTLLQIKEHLRTALELMDEIDPYAIVGARIQHCLDEVEEMISSGRDGS